MIAAIAPRLWVFVTVCGPCSDRRNRLLQFRQGKSFTQRKRPTRRGIFRDVEQLITAIQEFIEQHDTTEKPYVWTAKAD